MIKRKSTAVHADPQKLSASSSRSPEGPSTTARTPRKNAPSDNKDQGGDSLIVTRGLKEILEKDRRQRSTETRRSQGKPKSGGSADAPGPHFVVCYLCGRQFGTASISIHQPQCYLKKLIEWERGNPTTRGQKPIDPQTHEKIMTANLRAHKVAGKNKGAPASASYGAGTIQSDIELYNAMQMEAFNTNALVPCPNCGRTFLPDRLEVHKRSCKPGVAVKRVTAGTTLSKAAQPPAVVGATGESNGKSEAGRASIFAASFDEKKSPSASRPSAELSAHADEIRVRPSGSAQIPNGTTVNSAPRCGSHGASPDIPTTSPSARGFSSLPDDRATSVSEAALELAEKEPLPHEPFSNAVRAADLMGGSVSPARPAPMQERERQPSFETRRSLSEVRVATSNSVVTPLSVVATPTVISGAGTSASAPLTSANENTSNSPPVSVPALADASLEASASVVVMMDDQNTPSINGTPEEPRRKIQLNNVSRFKNVPSRLSMQKASANEHNVLQCKHCGRSFNPLRIEKHESVCIERNKTPQSVPMKHVAHTATKKGSPSASRRDNSHSSSASRPSAKCTADAPSGISFCGQCGAKVLTSEQKFCRSCGTTVVP